MNNYIDKLAFKNYSAGMKQRLANLIVLLLNANILVFDEPQNSLDQKGTDLFFNEIINLKRISNVVWMKNIVNPFFMDKNI